QTRLQQSNECCLEAEVATVPSIRSPTPPQEKAAVSLRCWLRRAPRPAVLPRNSPASSHTVTTLQPTARRISRWATSTATALQTSWSTMEEPETSAYSEEIATAVSNR